VQDDYSVDIDIEGRTPESVVTNGVTRASAPGCHYTGNVGD
jgi:hypothetical protein